MKRAVPFLTVLLLWSAATIAWAQGPSAGNGVTHQETTITLDSWDPAILQPASKYLVRQFTYNGELIDEIIVPGRPPKNFQAPVASVPESDPVAGVVILPSMPSFDWCYGCSATSAAMMMGYYDNSGYPNMYAGPANGGVCPMSNCSVWGTGECPLSATHQGYDGRSTKGHVDDYWRAYSNCDPDPYVGNWSEHASGDCTGDYMGTNQSKYSNCDGATTFYMNTNGSALCNYTGGEPARRDGCRGMRLFVESRGYTVSSNCSQYIYGYNGNTLGFTFAQYVAEIDAGRPVMIHVAGHSMVGYGYDSSTQKVYLRDTWDCNYGTTHTMTWGGTYSGLQHYGVTYLRLDCVAPTAPTSASNTGPICAGGCATLTAAGGSGTTMRWMTGSCGGATVGTGNNMLVCPGSTTTYYVRWENSCGNSTCVSTTVQVNPLPGVPSSPLAVPSTICVGGSSLLSGAPGAGGDTIVWHADSCGGTPVVSPVSPISTTSYYAKTKNSTTGCLSSGCTSGVTVQVVERPVVGTCGKTLTHSLTALAFQNYLFKLWGRAHYIDGDDQHFTLEDGSGISVKVFAPGFKSLVASGDFVVAQGILNTAPYPPTLNSGVGIISKP